MVHVSIMQHRTLCQHEINNHQPSTILNITIVVDLAFNQHKSWRLNCQRYERHVNVIMTQHYVNTKSTIINRQQFWTSQLSSILLSINTNHDGWIVNVTNVMVMSQWRTLRQQMTMSNVDSFVMMFTVVDVLHDLFLGLTFEIFGICRHANCWLIFPT